MPLRLAAACGLLVPVTFVAGLVLGDLVQPEAFSPADDDISDLGALTATHPWLYNQVSSNLTGILLLALALGLWRALGPGTLARLGVATFAVVGLGRFLEGFLRLDCQGIDASCENTSWHAEAHRVESGISAAATVLSPLILAFAFRRLPEWRRLWIPTLLALPASIAAGVVFSVLGEGAATRATSIVWTLWVGLVAYRLLRVSERDRGPSAAGAAG
ncbi:MAG TPA: DUF998 domain-containing protein [Gaiellaceae bacterium]|nr:DUF998 domain-containing protein [Gaiellaceae bacterium]